MWIAFKLETAVCFIFSDVFYTRLLQYKLLFMFKHFTFVHRQYVLRKANMVFNVNSYLLESYVKELEVWSILSNSCTGILAIKEGSPEVLVIYYWCHVFNIAYFKTTSLGDPQRCKAGLCCHGRKKLLISFYDANFRVSCFSDFSLWCNQSQFVATSKNL